MVVLDKVTKVFPGGVEALKGISLDIKKGDIYGIIGLSGAGKSTLLRCINGLETPTSGRVLVEGREVEALNKKELQELRQSIGMLFQSFNLFEAKKVFDNVAYPLKLKKVSKELQEKEVMKMLRLVGLDDKAQAYPNQLSGGQKQRVALARALISGPKILLLDEATSALDSATGQAVLELIEKIKEELDLTVILITHDLEVVRSICNQVAILEGGQLLGAGPIGEMFRGSHIRKIRQDLVIPPGVIKGRGLLLTFSGESAKEPIISNLIKEMGLDVNILLGKIEYVDHEPLGNLLVEIDSTQEDQVVSYLESKGVQVEVYYENN
ncbi:MAG: ATP-binding cassette domain-containing protein [Tissierellia bacterium]|nr:ATP-binding cassette domain-containing protein [Tissierellia bacterium]